MHELLPGERGSAHEGYSKFTASVKSYDSVDSISLIRALQRDHLPISEAEISGLLDVAVDITARLDASQVEGPNVDHLARAEEFARAVLMARQELMLSLGPNSWEAVLNDTARIRRGTIYDYPGF